MNKKMMIFLISLALPGMVMSGILKQLGVIPTLEWSKDPEVTRVQMSYAIKDGHVVWADLEEYNNLLKAQMPLFNQNPVENLKQKLVIAADCSHTPYRLEMFSLLTAAVSGTTIAVGSMLYNKANRDGLKYPAALYVASLVTMAGADLYRRIMLQGRDISMRHLGNQIGNQINFKKKEETQTGAGAGLPNVTPGVAASLFVPGGVATASGRHSTESNNGKIPPRKTDHLFLMWDNWC